MSIPLGEIFDQYCAAKINQGLRSTGSFREISRYIDFIRKRGESYITYANLTAFHKKRRKTLSNYSLQQSYQTLRQFSIWAKLVNNKNAELPHRQRRHNGRRISVILNPHQIEEIIEAMSKRCTQRPLSAEAYSTLIGLLFVTGMRISEAFLTLRDKDVNLKENLIYVREGKVPRDRFIPITPSTAKRLRDYRAKREQRFPGHTGAFFMIHTGVPRGVGSFRNIFAQITADLGYRSHDQVGYSSKALLPNDLRHSYATNMVVQFHDEGLDFKDCLPKLSTVLGHESSRETYWYIQSSPEILSKILQESF